jgi:hypothetical protein
MEHRFTFNIFLDELKWQRLFHCIYNGDIFVSSCLFLWYDYRLQEIGLDNFGQKPRRHLSICGKPLNILDSRDLLQNFKAQIAGLES